jgi:hypothetical protein
VAEVLSISGTAVFVAYVCHRVAGHNINRSGSRCARRVTSLPMAAPGLLARPARIDRSIIRGRGRGRGRGKSKVY